MARYSFLDATRGIAACSVMLQHSLYASGILGDFNSGRPLTGFIPTWLEFGETGVVAFFLVSGFVIPLESGKDREPAFILDTPSVSHLSAVHSGLYNLFRHNRRQKYPFDLDLHDQCVVPYFFPSGISKAREFCPGRLDAFHSKWFGT